MASASALTLLRSVAFFALILGVAAKESVSSDYMVCKPVAGVFGTIAGGENSQKGVMPVVQGPEGAPGPPGKTGLPGPRGEPNYQKVATIVGAKIQPLQARLYTAEKELKELKEKGVGGGGGGGGGGSSSGYVTPTQTPEEIANAKECLSRFKSPISIGNLCYNVIGGEGLLWTFDAAESNCTKLGGNLADFNSREVYDKLYNYIDSTYSTVVQAWTGMRYEDNKLLLRNGKEATYSKWSSGYPRKSTTSYYKSYKHVYIYMDTSAYIRRLSNTRSSTKRAYAICDYDLNSNSTTTVPDTPTSS